MTRSLEALMAAMLVACRPSSGDSWLGGTAPPPESSALSSTSAVDAASPMHERSSRAADADAGVREASATRVACGHNAHLNCTFRGRVRTTRPAVLEPGERPISQTGFPERATEVLLEEVPALECATMQIRGVQQGSSGVDGRGLREGPLFGFAGEMPMVRELVITLAPGVMLPFAEGEIICGSVLAFWISDIRSLEVLISRPNGDVLLAIGGLMPRDPSPLPGWTFILGRKRAFASPVNYYDMIVTHDGVSLQLPRTDEHQRLHAPDGEFLVGAAGYVTVGHLSEIQAYLAKKGYGFSILRLRDGDGGG